MPLPPRIRKHSGELHSLARAKPIAVKKIIRAADKDLVKTLCECSLNVLKGNVSISSRQKKRLSHHKKGLRELTQPKVSLKKKKVILQRGGFVGALLAGLLPALLTPILSRV